MKYLMLITIVVTLGVVSPISAQDADPAQRALQYGDAQKKNMGVLKQYSWKTRSDITSGGNPMLTTLMEARFDAEGELQLTTISTESHVEKKKGLRGKKQKKELEKSAALIEKVLGLQASYLMMSKGQLVDFFEKATFEDGSGEMKGMQKIHGKNVLVKNDELTIWVDPSTGLSQKLMFKSPLDEKTVVEGTIDYKKIKDGPTTASVSVLTVAAQGVSIKSERFDFIKQL